MSREIERRVIFMLAVGLQGSLCKDLEFEEKKQNRFIATRDYRDVTRFQFSSCAHPRTYDLLNHTNA